MNKTSLVFFLFFLLLTSQTINALPGEEMDFELPLSSFWPFSEAQIVHNAEDFIYLGSGNHILIFAITSDGSYYYEGNYSLPEPVTSIKTDEEKLFAGSHGGGLFVFPRGEIGSPPSKKWTQSSDIWHIQVTEERLFVSAGLDGLYVLKKDTLEKDLFIQAQSAIWKTFFRNNTIFLIDGLAAPSLFVIDLKEPEDDMERVILDLEEDEDPHDEIILPEEMEDIPGEEKEFPEQRHLATINRGNHIKDLAVSGNILYVADGHGGLALYDISNPVRIDFLQSFSTDDFGDDFIHTVRAENDRVIAAGKEGLYFLQNNEIKEKLSLELPFSDRIGPEKSFMNLSGEKATVISGIEGVLLLDISSLPAIKEVAKLEYPQRIEAIVLGQERAFLASGIERIWELNLNRNDEDLFSPLSWEEIPGMGQAIAKNDHHLFIATGIGIATVNKDTPGNMEFTGFLPFPYPDNRPDYKKGWTQDIAIHRNMAFVASGGGGIWIVDCIDPAQPVNLLLFSQGESVTKIAIDPENEILFAGGDPYLGAYDISSPHNPTKITEVELPTPPSAIDYYNNHLYVGQRFSSEERGQIKIFDYSSHQTLDEKNPLHLDHPGPNSFTIRDGRLLVLSREKGVEYFSLLSPANPVPEITLEIENTTLIEVAAPYLGLVSPDKGLFLFEY